MRSYPSLFGVLALFLGLMAFTACNDTDTVETVREVEKLVPGDTVYVCSDEDKTEVADPAMCPAPPAMPDCDHQLTLRDRVFDGSDGADMVCGSNYPDDIMVIKEMIRCSVTGVMTKLTEGTATIPSRGE